MQPVWFSRAPWALLAGIALLGGACAGATQTGAVPRPEQIPALEARLARSRGDLVTALQLASAYREGGQPERARALLEEAVRQHPKDGSAALLLGLAYEDAGQPREALRVYEGYLKAGGSGKARATIRRRLPVVQRAALQAAARAALAQEAALAQTAPQPRTVAVFPFLYTGEDARLRPLTRAVADMLITDLAQTGRLTVLERTQVQLLLDEMKLGASGLADTASAARTGHLLGAERVVQGAISGGEQALRLDAAVTRVGAEPGSGRVSEGDELRRLFDVEKRLAFGIYGSMGIQLTPAERERVNQRRTQNVQALLAYGLGLEAEDAGRFDEAAKQYRQAATLDPTFTTARERQDRAESAAEAQKTSTVELARETVAEAVMAPELASVETVAPRGTVDRRDPASEALGSEGLVKKTIIDLVIRPR